MGFIFIIKLVNGTYYIGYSSKEKSLKPIFTHNLSNIPWVCRTSLESVIKIIEIPKISDINERLNMYTFISSFYYGYENVRGGTFSDINLSFDKLSFLRSIKTNIAPNSDMKTIISKIEELKHETKMRNLEFIKDLYCPIEELYNFRKDSVQCLRCQKTKELLTKMETIFTDVNPDNEQIKYKSPEKLEEERLTKFYDTLLS